MLISKLELDSKGSRDLIPLECYQCKNTHYRPKNIVLRVLNGNQQGTMKACFCSNICKYNYKKISPVICNCKQCGNVIEKLPSEIGKNVFCNHSCAAMYNNTQRGKIEKSCPACLKKFYPQKGNAGKFCSRQCNFQYKKKLLYDKILTTDGKGISNQTLRQFLIQTRGQKCEICGIDKWLEKPLIVIMDHIDGHHENDSLKNLRLICSNCDTTLPTYKARNKGNERQYRRKNFKLEPLVGHDPTTFTLQKCCSAN